MDLGLTINDTALAPGGSIADDLLSAAGLGRMSAWRRVMLRLGSQQRYFEARDPRVACFDGEVEIYPCRHGYLDPDRRWGTSCLVGLRDQALSLVEFRVIEGVYAASNLYDRFVDSAGARLGAPTRDERRLHAWRLNGLAITAELDRERLNAVFRVELVGAGAGGGNGGSGGSGGNGDRPGRGTSRGGRDDGRTDHLADPGSTADRSGG